MDNCNFISVNIKDPVIQYKPNDICKSTGALRRLRTVN